MSGTLYVVATPIGNLEDVTLRALRVLREVSLIAAEDTRRTSRLLQHYSISTPTTSLHAHNERVRTPALVARLRQGESIALVSDAGTPGISDPGMHLVAAAHSAGIRVEPVPGASAAVAAVSVSGLASEGFRFVGFLPYRSKDRNSALEGLADVREALVFFEAPHRIRQSISSLLTVLGDRKMVLARELTKIHEEVVVRPISEHLTNLTEGRGEYTLVVQGAVAPVSREEAQDLAESVRDKFDHLTKSGLNRRIAIKSVADSFGLSTKRVFALLEATKPPSET